MDNTLMSADGAALKIDDVARLYGIRPQPTDDIGIASGRHETDVLAILLVRDGQSEAPRQVAGLGFGHVAQRKAQILKLIARRCEQKVALVAIGVGGANQRARSIAGTPGRDIMAGS